MLAYPMLLPLLPLLLGCFCLEHQSSDIQSVVSLWNQIQASLNSLLILAQAQELLYAVKVESIDSLLTKPLSNDSLR